MGAPECPAYVGQRLQLTEAMRPRVAIALYGDLTHDGRVQREAASLANAGYRVTVLALAAGDVSPEFEDDIEYLAWSPGATAVLPGTWSPFYPENPGTKQGRLAGQRLGWFAGYVANLRAWGRWAVHSGGQATVWHAVDFTGLVALALGRLPRSRRLIYDSHELYLESGTAVRLPRPAHWLLKRVEGRLARRAEGVITVNQSIADELVRRYGVDPVVVMNCPPLAEVARPGALRTTLGVGERPVLLHHGSLSAGRGIEQTVAALEHLPADMVLVLLGDGPLVPWIQEQRLRPELAGRLLWHPAVPLEDISSWVVDADLGVMLFEPTELNFLYATPNRLFDCIAAGVPVIASDFPEFRRIVIGYAVGAVCDPTDPRLIRDSINQLLSSKSDLAAMSDRARRASRQTLNWESQANGMLDLYRRIAPPRDDR